LLICFFNLFKFL